MKISSPKSRTQKAKLNMAFSLLQQGVSFFCGLIVPRLMIGAFGSVAYGATSSIANFLSYVTLLEGGLGAVTRAALYKAFAKKSNDDINAIIIETKSLYQKIAIVFTGYVLILATFFKQISHNDVFSFGYSFLLVLVISISTFASYFIGITYSLLIQADQKVYIISVNRIITTILNTIAIYVLIKIECNLLIVKLASSLVFVLRPVLLSKYAKKTYNLYPIHRKESSLKDKESALGQHIAWALHNNTDITVLTVFTNLSLVSVYTVYSMIITQLQNILNSFTSGMEAVFGSMLGNNELEKLKKTFGYYETLISLISVTILSSAMILIVPFIKLYTSGITDTNYVHFGFAFMLIQASLLYTMRLPYERLVIAAGHFKETQIAAYGEAIINVIVSVVLVMRYGLIGVAVGTVVATLFRFVYYAVYLSRHILYRSISHWVKRIIINYSICFVILIIKLTVFKYHQISNYILWVITGIIVTIITGSITFILNYALYREDIIEIIRRGLGKGEDIKSIVADQSQL